MKSIYCLLANQPYLRSISGDRINEINTYRILSENYDVYYNNRKFNFADKKYFGTNPKDKVMMPNRKYDLYYVRNNPQIFLKLPDPKIYFCIPNHQECFRKAAGLVFPTRSWRDKIRDRDFTLLTRIYKKTDYFPKHLLEYSQVTYPEDLSKHPKTIKYKNLFGNGFIIGHFGRVVKSNTINFIPALAERTKANIVFVGGGGAVKSKRYRHISHIPKEDVKYAISACNVLLYNQDLQGHFSGALKIIDALNYGVPITSPKYDARVDELGEDYPLYVEEVNGKIKLNSLVEKINWLKNNSQGMREYLFKRAEYYNLSNSIIRYKNQTSNILGL